MSSVIYYKFKAAKDHDVCSFDGPSISVFDLKKEIITQKKLGKGLDFDLAIYNAQTNEEYAEDHQMVPRNSSILVRRLPAAKMGKGTAQRYVSGVMASGGHIASNIGPGGSGAQRTPSAPPTHANKNLTYTNPQLLQQQGSSGSKENGQGQTGDVASQQNDATAPADDSEEGRIAAMFAQTTEQWKEQQNMMAGQQYIPFQHSGGARGRGRGITGPPRGGTQPQAGARFPHGADSLESPKIPPPNYVCFRCGQKGHYINNCPTNNDRSFDSKPRIKRTTGIPRSFLKVVEANGDSPAESNAGVMVTPNGDLVVAQADSQAWDQMMKRTMNNRDLADTSDLTDLYPLVPVKKEFECPLCSGLFREAVIITCCGTTFCDECIRQELLDKDFVCPKCGAKDQALDSLIPNLGVRQSVNHYVSEWLRANPTRDTSSNGTEGNGKSLNKRPLESSAANEPQAQRQKQQ